MIPRTCPNDRCDYDTTGWIHDPQCRAGNATGRSPDWRDATDLEDGVASRWPTVPAQQRRAA